MALEDHIGDIIRKSRNAKGVSADTAASAAGVTTAELAGIEESGGCSRELNFMALAQLLGLDAAKLVRIAEGWLPPEIDTTQWREFRKITTSGGNMSVNCYLIWDEVTRDAALFDTGFEATPVFELIDANQLTLRHIFITHSHYDHVEALAPLRERFPKAKLHSGSKNAPVDQRNRANDFIHLGSLRITNRDTPGHAEDGVTYVIGTWPDDAPHVAIVGDAIFAGSMGKALGPSFELAKQKIRDQIFALPSDTLVCPGHGPSTTVALEKANNPFFP